MKNTQQITKAMKMMSAARLRRAQERVLGARPGATALRNMLTRIVAGVEANRPIGDDGPIHPLLARREEKRILLLILGGDKGLAGAFNTNINKSAMGFLAKNAGKPTALIAIGKKPRDFFRRRGELAAEFADIFVRVSYKNAQDIAKLAIDRYNADETDAVYLIYNEFKSVLVQRLRVERLLPLETPAPDAGLPIDYIFEQPPQEILNDMLPQYVEVQVFRALLESAAAEHAARMTAMDSASKNAAEMIDRLTLKMNRIRQATITREIIEIVSGAAALG